MTTTAIQTSKKNPETRELPDVVVDDAIAIDDINVAHYLEANPDYFDRHPELLAELSLPHQSGNAVSLVERQVAVLRERSKENRHKLSELIDVAKENDQLFSASQKLILELLDAKSLDELFKTMQASLNNDFGIDSAALLCFTSSDTNIQGSYRSLESGSEHIPTLLEGSQTFCGILREEEANYIFGEQQPVNSAAIVRREIFPPENESDAPTIIMIAVGHADAAHYSNETGTLFIDYLIDTLTKLARRLL